LERPPSPQAHREQQLSWQQHGGTTDAWDPENYNPSCAPRLEFQYLSWLCLIIVHLRKDLVDTLGAPEVVPGVKSTNGNPVNCRFAYFQCAAFTWGKVRHKQRLGSSLSAQEIFNLLSLVCSCFQSNDMGVHTQVKTNCAQGSMCKEKAQFFMYEYARTVLQFCLWRNKSAL
jgi:hypothetical protein